MTLIRDPQFQILMAILLAVLVVSSLVGFALSRRVTTE